MKIVQINSVPNGSTGSIMMNIHNELLKQGHESYVVWGRGRKAQNKHEIYMNDKLGVLVHVLYSRITGKVGFASKIATKKLLKKIDKIKPDIIHLHNIHGYYINIEILFKYLKKNNIKTVWTLHDCWTFTGHCSYFDMVKCNRWKNQCENCPQKQNYPKTMIDNSKWCYKKKKNIFLGANITIVTPSKWLANLVKESFLKNYKVKVVNNGIDTSIFKPTCSNFRKKYGLSNKYVILGVANIWEKRKGLDDFIELSRIIDKNYKIVLVGLSKKQISALPKNIIGLEKTKGKKELAKIYTMADAFFNPTYEDNYPTVNLEALACNLPVITYNTGGSPESAGSGAIIISRKDLNNYNEIFRKNTIETDKVKKINSINDMVNSYINIYKQKS